MEGSPNLLAWTAIILCVPVTLAIVARWRPAISVPVVFLASVMFLPPIVGFDVPYLVTLDKSILPQWAALLGCVVFWPKSLVGSKPGRGLDLFIVLRLLGYLGSCLTNRDPLIFPRGFVPGLSFFTFLSGSVNIILYWWPPVFLGRTVIKTSRDLRNLFLIFVGAAVIYSFFAMVEMVFSPQVNLWIYGYHQSNFVQAVKGSHFRPMVFMNHGLGVAFFFSLSIMCAAGLAKIKARLYGFRAAGVVTIFLATVLLLCHSLGAFVYVALTVPLIWWTNPRTQTRIATIVALLAFSYPLARAVGIVPVDQINAFVLDKFGRDRAGSIGLRLSEEAYVMDRALQRPVFGWGGGSRSFRLDPITGENRSTTDGLWAIELGVHGAVGFLGLFGMLLYPVWRSRRSLRRLTSREDRVLVSCLALIGAVYMVELIPNATIEGFNTFLVGVLSRAVTVGLEPDSSAAPVAVRQWPGPSPDLAGVG